MGNKQPTNSATGVHMLYLYAGHDNQQLLINDLRYQFPNRCLDFVYTGELVQICQPTEGLSGKYMFVSMDDMNAAIATYNDVKHTVKQVHFWEPVKNQTTKNKSTTFMLNTDVFEFVSDKIRSVEWLYKPPC